MNAYTSFSSPSFHLKSCGSENFMGRSVCLSLECKFLPSFLLSLSPSHIHIHTYICVQNPFELRNNKEPHGIYPSPLYPYSEQTMCKKRNSHSSLIASRPIGMLGYTAIIPAVCRPCLQVAKTTCHYDNNTPGV